MESTASKMVLAPERKRYKSGYSGRSALKQNEPPLERLAESNNSTFVTPTCSKYTIASGFPVSVPSTWNFLLHADSSTALISSKYNFFILSMMSTRGTPFLFLLMFLRLLEYYCVIEKSCTIVCRFSTKIFMDIASRMSPKNFRSR